MPHKPPRLPLQLDPRDEMIIRVLLGNPPYMAVWHSESTIDSVYTIAYGLDKTDDRFVKNYYSFLHAYTKENFTLDRLIEIMTAEATTNRIVSMSRRRSRVMLLPKRS